MQRLFERKKKQHLSNIELPVTEAVFIVAAANTNNGDSFVDLLLDHQKKESCQGHRGCTSGGNP
jgi:hypothetical protein